MLLFRLLFGRRFSRWWHYPRSDKAAVIQHKIPIPNSSHLQNGVSYAAIILISQTLPKNSSPFLHRSHSSITSPTTITVTFMGFFPPLQILEFLHVRHSLSCPLSLRSVTHFETALGFVIRNVIIYGDQFLFFRTIWLLKLICNILS